MMHAYLLSSRFRRGSTVKVVRRCGSLYRKVYVGELVSTGTLRVWYLFFRRCYMVKVRSMSVSIVGITYYVDGSSRLCRIPVRAFLRDKDER